MNKSSEQQTTKNRANTAKAGPFAIVLFVVEAIVSFSGIASQAHVSQPELLQLMRITDSIQQYLETDELPPVQRLHSIAKNANDTIETHKTTAHWEAMESLRLLDMRCRFSEAHWASITRAHIASELKQITEVCAILAQRHGFDHSQGAKLIKYMMIQLHDQLQLLKNHAEPFSNLKDLLEKSAVEVKKAQVIGEQGDRPLAFQQGNTSVVLVDEIIKILMTHNGSSVTHQVGIQILRQVEEYKHYAQFYDLRLKKSSGGQP